MLRKTIALATLASFLVFSFSCVSYRKTPLVSVKPEKRTKVKISAVQVHSGEMTEFGKEAAASIQGDSIIGTKFVKNFKLETPKIKQPLRQRTGGGYEITAADGILYTVYRVIAQDDSGVTFDGYYQVSIALANIDYVWIKHFNALSTLLLIVAIPVGILFILYAAFDHGG